MNEAITVELQFFLISILWGAIILLVYDILRIFRRLIPHNSIFLALEDLIFWVLASVFIFAMIYTMNNGTIRGFSVIGMGIGMTLYHFIFSELVVKWITKVLLLLLSPLKFFIGRIKRVLHFFASRLKKVLVSVLSRLKKTVKSVKIALNTKRKKRTEKRSKQRELKTAKKALADSKKADKPLSV
jgi:spore cortex biosynthesis protein YabQ